jgi:hypothetical protein
MNDETTARYETQARRARRIAASIVDDDIRHALEHLAEEYEARADEHAQAESGGPFMLNSERSDEQRGASS